jgi:hypothetical protein
VILQHSFPLRGSIWNPDAPVDRTGFALRAPEALDALRVAVVGTVRDQRIPAERTWGIWRRQAEVPGVEVEFWMLDDGSADGTEDAAARWAFEDPRLRYAKFREPGGPDRSCTLLLNWAIRNIDADLLIIHWWDRIPDSLYHLRKLVIPHIDGTEELLTRAPIVTSAQSRHIGGSSSVDELSPDDLAARLSLVPWKDDPSTLSRIAGPAGGHTVPGYATESSEFCVRRSDLVALGGYDERYVTRHGYPNVDLWRRLLHAGFVGAFPVGLANYHQSHPAGGPRSGKDTSLLSDLRLVRNVGEEWGNLEPMLVL